MARTLRDRPGKLFAWLRAGAVGLRLMRALASEQRWEARWRRGLIKERWRPQPRPHRHRDGSVDWSEMNYVEVCDTDFEEGPLNLDALLDGPMKRLFDICEDDLAAVRAAARVMEFARGPVARFKDRQALSEQKARQVDDIVMAELERRFGWRGSDGRYLIDVYLGKRDHNC